MPLRSLQTTPCGSCSLKKGSVTQVSLRSAPPLKCSMEPPSHTREGKAGNRRRHPATQCAKLKNQRYKLNRRKTLRREQYKKYFCPPLRTERGHNTFCKTQTEGCSLSPGLQNPSIQRALQTHKLTPKSQESINKQTQNANNTPGKS